MASAMRPSRLRPSARSLLAKRSRPATSPPPSMPSSSSTGAAPGRLKNRRVWPLPGNSCDSPTDTAVAALPSTSAWLPPTNTPSVPSSAGICVVWTYRLSSRISWSRLSSRSLGAWPLPLTRATWSLGAAAHARGHLVQARERDGARRDVGGRCHHVGQRVEHVADGRAQAAGAALEHVLQLREALGAHRVAGLHRLGGRGLAREQLVVVAQDRKSTRLNSSHH